MNTAPSGAVFVFGELEDPESPVIPATSDRLGNTTPMPGNGVSGGAGYGDLLVTSLIVLGVVSIVAVVAVRVLGRWMATGRTRGAHVLDVVARLPLEPRRSLYVVEVAGKTLLVGTSEMGLSVLSELDGSEVRARVVERPGFADLVARALGRKRPPPPAPPPGETP